MTPKLTITALFCFCTLTTFAQTNYTIRGSVTDTTSKTKIDGVTICVLNAKDSILQKFTYSNKGSFRINNLKPGKLLLLISYPDYADYTADFVLDVTHPIKDFGDLNLISKSRLLNGLPGMILGVAVPHENVTWFATKVTEGPVDSKTLVAPKNGKLVNNKQLYNDLLMKIKGAGDYEAPIIVKKIAAYFKKEYRGLPGILIAFKRLSTLSHALSTSRLFIFFSLCSTTAASL